MSDNTSAELSAIADALESALDAPVHRDHPIGPLTTYRVGGNAAVAVEPRNRADIETVAAVLSEFVPPVAVVGQGSNLLVADAGFDGVVLITRGPFDDVTITGTSVHVDAGVRLPLLARQTVAAGLTGFEWAVGVPGSIGGAIRMNAGGHGSDMAASVAHSEIVDLHRGITEVWDADRLAFGYRTSALENHHCVLSCELTLEPGDPAAGDRELKEIVRWRREHQPGGQNAGSVFTNPEGDSAGRLIDACGGKGMRVGSAEVSTKHANFIQADDQGSADDILALMIAVMALVEQQTGVQLHAETRLLGYDGIARQLQALHALEQSIDQTSGGSSS